MRRLAILLVLLFACSACGAADDYVLGPDSQRQPGIPRGTITQHKWTSSIYPGTVRDYWIYVPAQYKPDHPACLMVFQDGGGMVSETGGWRVPVVFDNLINKGEMPSTIGVFINPGILPAPAANQQDRYNRSYEYDALGDRYARFLAEELLPQVASQYNLSKNPNDRAISGSSSGGMAAFNAAWERPDLFRRVVSFIGSYTTLRGGDTLAGRIRKTEPKPLRVFLQDGSNDLNIYAGNWLLGNQQIFSALDFMGYESTLVVGTEGHNGKHGGAILPDALRWIWKGYPRAVAKPEKFNDRGIYTIIEPGQEWELLGQGYQLTADSAVDKQGNVYFTDARNNRIDKIDTTGKITVWKENSGGAHGIVFGGDGRLYAGQHERKRIVALTPDGTESVLAEGVQTHHLAITARNELYLSDAPNHRVWFLNQGGEKKVATSDVDWPRGVHVSADQSLVVVNDPNTKWVWSFQIAADGTLKNGERFYRLETPDEASGSEAGGMTFDTEGFLYVATTLGVQVCDQPGRVMGIIDRPGAAGLSNVFFAGPDMQWLYVTDGDKIYRRRVKRTGASPWNAVKPPQPRL